MFVTQRAQTLEIDVAVRDLAEDPPLAIWLERPFLPRATMVDWREVQLGSERYTVRVARDVTHLTEWNFRICHSWFKRGWLGMTKSIAPVGAASLLHQGNVVAAVGDSTVVWLIDTRGSIA